MPEQYLLRDLIRKIQEAGMCKEEPPVPDLDKAVDLPTENLNTISKILSTISEPLRLKILYLLRQSPLPVCIIAFLLKTDRTLVSHHMNKLLELGLVKVERSRRFSIYSLTDQGKELVKAIEKILENR
ncbi:MAG: metalloregulator ArsR/SmtB family transcription factor [Fervidicoccaceae archaeon]